MRLVRERIARTNMKLKFAILALALAWFGRDGVRAEEAKEPTVAELKAQVAALKAENDGLKQRLTLTDARCKALAEFYQTDAALKQLDQQKEKK